MRKSLSCNEPAVGIEPTTARIHIDVGSSKCEPTLRGRYTSVGPQEPRKAALGRGEVPTNRPSAADSVKVCRRCHEEKPLTAFTTRRQDGKVYPHSYCRACKTAHECERYRLPERKQAIAERDRRARERYPERRRARTAVRHALSAGWLVVGPCYAEGPDCRGAIDAHHDDYAEPLAVTWACHAHHTILDRQRREREGKVA